MPAPHTERHAPLLTPKTKERDTNSSSDTKEFAGDPFAEGMAFVGTTDTVTRQLEHLCSRIPFEWVFAWQYNGLVSDAQSKKSIEQWATEIVPRVDRWEAE